MVAQLHLEIEDISITKLIYNANNVDYNVHNALIPMYVLDLHVLMKLEISTMNVNVKIHTMEISVKKNVKPVLIPVKIVQAVKTNV